MKFRKIITGITDTRKAVDYFRLFHGKIIPLNEALAKSRGPFPIIGEWFETHMNIYEPMTTEELLKWKRLQDNGVYKSPEVDPMTAHSDEEEFGIAHHYEYEFRPAEKEQVTEALAKRMKVDEAFRWLATRSDEEKAFIELIVGVRSAVYG